jgi:hypothetical protein
LSALLTVSFPPASTTFAARFACLAIGLEGSSTWGCVSLRKPPVVRWLYRLRMAAGRPSCSPDLQPDARKWADSGLLSMTAEEAAHVGKELVEHSGSLRLKWAEVPRLS